MKVKAECECGRHKLKEFDLHVNQDATIPNTPCGGRWRLVALVSAQDAPKADFPANGTSFNDIFGDLFRGKR